MQIMRFLPRDMSYSLQTMNLYPLKNVDNAVAIDYLSDV